MKVYFCIDLKTFYASVECVERNLDPFKTDLIVADISRGKGTVCLAITPKMKNRGIKNRCRYYEIPSNVHPIIAKPRMKKYIEYSARVYAIYLKYVSKDDIHPYSIDEMFLDVTSYLKLYRKTPVALAKTILKDIYDTLGITATAGIGTNLFLAKVALDIKSKHSKSNIGILTEKMFKEELWHHKPITDFWRISFGIEKRLKKLKINDMYDIVHTNPKILYKEFGINAEYLIDHANGKESCTIKDIKEYKKKNHSISNSQILFRDYNFKESRIVLSEMINNLVLILNKNNYVTNHIGFKIGYTHNEIKPTKISLKIEQTSSYSNILEILLNKYDLNVDKEIMIRKISIFFNAFKSKYRQLDLFEEYKNVEQEEKINETVLKLNKKYGLNTILKGNSYFKSSNQKERNKLIGGHNAE